MSRYFRRNIALLEGYLPGEQPQDGGYVKLNTNENPYAPSPRVLSALRKAADQSLRLYPEPLGRSLRSLAAATYGVGPENVLAGNGSDELLSILTRCFVRSGDRVVYAVPTYTLYDTLVAIQEGEKVEVAYPADFAIPDALSSQKAALTFLCNPNSPSGTLVSVSEIERLARSVSGILVVDEAYIDFADEERVSAIPLLQRSPNLVVLRSFSKSFSLAGMRIGLAFAAEEIIAGMIKVKDSYNLNRLSLAAAVAALNDLSWMERNVRRIQRSRKRLTRGLQRSGFEVLPSQANFVMARKKGENLRLLYEELKRRKILVRYFDAPGLHDSLRITVGTPREIDALLEEIKGLTKRPFEKRVRGENREGKEPPMRPVRIFELDHIVLNVRDIDRSLAFYTQVLALKGERVEEFKAGKAGFPSVRINEHTIIDLNLIKSDSVEGQKKIEKREKNLNHFCLVAERVDLAEIIEYLKNHKVPVLRGPVSRWGARGRATSIYLLDPDGNEIEIRCY